MLLTFKDIFLSIIVPLCSLVIFKLPSSYFNTPRNFKGCRLCKIFKMIVWITSGLFNRLDLLQTCVSIETLLINQKNIKTNNNDLNNLKHQ